MTRFGILTFLLLAAPELSFAGPQDMDYGPFLSGTFKASWPADNTVLKGIAVKFDTPLGGETKKEAGLGGVLFDTEMLRVAAVWNGGFIQLKGVVFDGAHGANPLPAGTQWLGATNGPGWAKENNWKDPRAIPHGPLPRDWARYKGLYRTEKGVIFTYTVGEASVLDMPTIEVVENVRLLSRALSISSSKQPMLMDVADVDGAKGKIEGGFAILEKSGTTTLARLVGGKDAALEILNGTRIALKTSGAAAETLRLLVWSGPNAEVEKVKTILAKATAGPDLGPLTKTGVAVWKESVTTKGVRGDDKAAYALDEIAVPFKNPSNSWMRIGGFDFFSDGRAAVSTWSGDVWIVSGIDAGLEKITWKRYAGGLFHALGLKIVKDQIYVLGRDQITRLHDLNNDGEADFYECFNNDVMITSNFHEFAFELQTDKEGNFYFTKGGPVRPGGSGWDKITPHHGCVFKVAADGSKLEVVARGLRAPNGMGIGPDGQITTGDNEGTWTPMCPLNWIKKDGFYGVPDFSDRSPKPTVRDNPLCWFPKEIDNSNGGQVWITGDKFGPLSGQLLHMSYGTCTLYEVLKEEVGGLMQGGVVPVPLKFGTGICRGRFVESQNALYLAGLRGWQTSASKDAGFYRVRYTGKPAYMPTALHVVPGEVRITFSDPIDRASGEDADNFNIQRWNYRWTQNYGSPHVKVSNPKVQGHDDVEIEEAKLSADGKTVTLKIKDLKPVMQMKIDYKLKAADGTALKSTIHHTINVVGDQKGEIHPGELKIVPLARTEK